MATLEPVVTSINKLDAMVVSVVEAGKQWQEAIEVARGCALTAIQAQRCVADLQAMLWINRLKTSDEDLTSEILKKLNAQRETAANALKGAVETLAQIKASMQAMHRSIVAAIESFQPVLSPTQHADMADPSLKEASVFAEAIRKLMENRHTPFAGWTGAWLQLLDEVGINRTNSIASKFWPLDARKQLFDQMKVVLYTMGIELETRRNVYGRENGLIILTRIGGEMASPVQSGPDGDG